MPHDPFIYKCHDCDHCYGLYQDGIEVDRLCNLDNKTIQSWGRDVCLLKPECLHSEAQLHVDLVTKNMKSVFVSTLVCDLCKKVIYKKNYYE